MGLPRFGRPSSGASRQGSKNGSRRPAWEEFNRGCSLKNRSFQTNRPVGERVPRPRSLHPGIDEGGHEKGACFHAPPPPNRLSPD